MQYFGWITSDYSVQISANSPSPPKWSFCLMCTGSSCMRYQTIVLFVTKGNRNSSPWKSCSNDRVAWMGLSFYGHHCFHNKRPWANAYAHHCSSKLGVSWLILIVIGIPEYMKSWIRKLGIGLWIPELIIAKVHRNIEKGR